MTTTKKATKPKARRAVKKTSLAMRTPERKVHSRTLDAVGDQAVRETREILAQAITDSGVRHIELSERLGTTRSNVSQILGRGKGNPTVRMVSKWLYAMGYRLVISFEPLEDDTK